MSPRNQKLSARIDGRLAAYATLAGVALAAPAMAPSADADIIWSGPVNINIPSNIAGIYGNFVTNMWGTNAGTPGWDVNPYGSTTLTMFNPAAPPGGVYVGDGTGYFNLTPGTLINGSSTYTSGNVSPSTPLNFNSSNNLIGIRFQNEAMGNVTEYGWMRIMLSATQGSQPRAVVEYAYQNNPDLGINAGAIPEPTTAALLGVMAAGALGVRAWRKRKAA